MFYLSFPEKWTDSGQNVPQSNIQWWNIKSTSVQKKSGTRFAKATNLKHEINMLIPTCQDSQGGRGQNLHISDYLYVIRPEKQWF